MKTTIILMLAFAMVSYGQERSLPPQKIIPQGSLGTVTLALAEYNRLVELGAHKPKPADTAPLSFILSRAAFKLRIENESVIGTLGIDGEVLRKGQVKVPLISGLTVIDAEQSQKPLPLFQEDSTHVAVLGGPAPFSVSLQVASPMTVDAGRASFSLSVPSAGSSMLSLEIPGNHANVHVERGLITARTTLNGNTAIEASLEPGKSAKIWWTTREATAPVSQREVRFLSEIKSIVSVGDSEVRLAALCDITVIQGEPAEFRLQLPAGYEVTEASGASLDSSETQSGWLVLKVREPARRAHQFLVAIERPSRENKLDAPLFTFSGAQRETAEVLVEGAGTMELTAAESGGLKRIDPREASPISRSFVRFALQAAFRYHRRPGDSPKLALEWNQFPDSTVLSAIAERATITTLVNVEGKSLTEVTLRLRNHAQPFVKVDLPQGASLLSAEVEGERVKPVQGPDGSRVPLLRTGFRSSGVYSVSFVYLNAGSAFAKSGAYEMNLPKLDLPVNLVTWEVFLPDRLEVKQFAGNAISADYLPTGAIDALANARSDDNESEYSIWVSNSFDLASLSAGQIGGIVADQSGAVIQGAVVTVSNTQTGSKQSARSDADGHWVLAGIPPGPAHVKIEATGFKPYQQELDLSSTRPSRLGVTLDVGGVAETVTVNQSTSSLERESRRLEEQASKARQAQLNAPSQNVLNLQKRVAGILPVRVEVPRAGKSYRFVRPLVLDEETKITFQYKRT